MAPNYRNLLWTALAACLLMLSSPPASAVTTADIIRFNEVRELVAAGNRTRAILVLEEMVAQSITGDPERTAALIEEVAELYIAENRHTEAGEALSILTDLLGRLRGPTSPELARVHDAAGSAHAAAGNLDAAISHYEDALAIDRRYQDCAADFFNGALARLAELHGERGHAQVSGRLAELSADTETRCADPAYEKRTRGVIAETAFEGATQKSYATVQVFYATDRARTGSLRPNDFYGGERGELGYGVLDVTVPRTHKPGEIEAPSLLRVEWSENPERHIVIMRLETLSGDEMYAQMREALSERAAKEAFVFIHGYNVTFDKAARRAAQIAYDLNFEGAPLLYSWPSRGSPFSYISDEAVVRLGGRRLMSVLKDVTRRSGAERVHIIAHSMGNRALLDALELISVEHSAAGKTEPLFDQVVFTAPDEDAGLFADMLQRIRPVARRLTLYASEQDLALSASRTLHGEAPRAGQAGADILVTEEIDSIDMTVLGEDMLGHSYFASSTSALSDILWLFWRDTPPELRCGMTEASVANGRHWMFDPRACNGGVTLSALTLARNDGAAALDVARQMLQRLGGDENRAAEWRAIADMLKRVFRR